MAEDDGRRWQSPDVLSFVQTGLDVFTATHGAATPGAAACSDPARPDWPALAERFGKDRGELEGRLGQLVRDLQLDLASFFVLALTGAVESSHRTALAVAKLQGAEGQGHPTLHLIEALA